MHVNSNQAVHGPKIIIIIIIIKIKNFQLKVEKK